MKYILLFVTIFLYFVYTPFALPVDTKDIGTSQSAFGQPFDEIVVESSLTVKRKSKIANDQRNGKKQDVSSNKSVQKRQVHHGLKQNPGYFNQPTFPNFSSINLNSQTQHFKSSGPVGNFGASASGTQSQSFNFHPNGLNTAVAAFSGTQQYQINGQTIDISFGNGFGKSGLNQAGSQGFSINVSGPDGIKRPLNKQ